MPPKEPGTRKKRSDAGTKRKKTSKKKRFTQRVLAGLESVKGTAQDVGKALVIAGAVAGAVGGVRAGVRRFRSQATEARRDAFGLNRAELDQEVQAEFIRKARNKRDVSRIFQKMKDARGRLDVPEVEMKKATPTEQFMQDIRAGKSGALKEFRTKIRVEKMEGVDRPPKSLKRAALADRGRGGQQAPPPKRAKASPSQGQKGPSPITRSERAQKRQKINRLTGKNVTQTRLR